MLTLLSVGVVTCTTDKSGDQTAPVEDGRAPDDHTIDDSSANSVETSPEADQGLDAIGDNTLDSPSADSAAADGEAAAADSADGDAGDSAEELVESEAGDAPDEAVGESSTADGIGLDEGASDAGPDATDAGSDAAPSVNTASVILAAQGTSCEACAEQMCLDAGGEGGTGCERLGDETADAGGAAGQSRQKLCYDTLSCILNTNSACYNAGVLACYCGPDLVDCADAGPSAGAACPSQEANGLETMDPATVIQRFHDETLGAGVANALVECLFGCASCLP